VQILYDCGSIQMTWTPILSRQSDLGAQAWDAVQTIAQAVADKNYEVPAEQRRRSRTYEEALLYGYLAAALDDLEWANRATECLNQAIDEAAQSANYLGLFGGLTGLGWTVEHISHLLQGISVPADNDSELASDHNEVEEVEEEDLNGDIDSAVFKRLPNTSSSSPYDLISGLVGFGTYFLERLPRESAIQGIRAVFDQLENLAKSVDDGTAWHSGPELLPDWQREQAPSGYYNLGVAHGIPGIIHFLSEAWATGIVERERSYKLLDRAVSWLIAQQRPSGSLSRFSSWIVPGEDSTDSRMAWCYGDLGILSVLLQVADRTGRPDWRAFAEELLNHCLVWPVDRAGIADAPLCHGAAGVAHIFNRIYQTGGDLRCRDAALLWYQRTMDFRQAGSGVGGFSSLTRPAPTGLPVWEASPAFLDGAAGVALAFLSAVTPVEPGWDRMLLISGKYQSNNLIPPGCRIRL
jgi:lantibiotic biosynthesis protein